MRKLRWLMVFLYAGLAVFTGFLHTESSPFESKDCPACQFLKAAVSLSAAPVFIPDIIISSERIAPERIDEVTIARVLELVSRAPPLV